MRRATQKGAQHPRVGRRRLVDPFRGNRGLLIDRAKKALYVILFPQTDMATTD